MVLYEISNLLADCVGSVNGPVLVLIDFHSGMVCRSKDVIGIMDTKSDLQFATYTVLVTLLIAIEVGRAPTGMVSINVFVLPEITDTEFET